MPRHVPMSFKDCCLAIERCFAPFTASEGRAVARRTFPEADSTVTVSLQATLEGEVTVTRGGSAQPLIRCKLVDVYRVDGDDETVLELMGSPREGRCAMVAIETDGTVTVEPAFNLDE